MDDPRFETREDLGVWEKGVIAAFVKRARSSDAGFVNGMIATSRMIERVRQQHAHLLTPESDNG